METVLFRTSNAEKSCSEILVFSQWLSGHGKYSNAGKEAPGISITLQNYSYYCLKTSKNSVVYKQYCEVFLTQYRMSTLYRIKTFDSPYNTKFYFQEPLAQGLEKKKRKVLYNAQFIKAGIKNIIQQLGICTDLFFFFAETCA